MKAACRAVALCTSIAASAVLAQPASKAPAPELRYTSAFADYKPWQDSPPGDWRRINDDVGSRGGMGMSLPVPMPASEAASAAPLPAMKHGKHGGHGARP